MEEKVKVLIVIAHYGLDRKITQQECEAAIASNEYKNIIYIDFDAGFARLNDLYDLPFDNVALAQQRQFIEKVAPVLAEHPTAQIAYFGYAPIPVAFHFGYLMGNTHAYTVYQWHHAKRAWYKETEPPITGYTFELVPIALPLEVQKGKGDISVRIGTSFSIDPKATLEVIANPANEFDIALRYPDPDALYSQHRIEEVVNAFQSVLNTYANKLSDRELIHLFLACSAGLPFALGTRINPNIYPFVQTYQFSRERTPKYKEAILISKEVNDRIPLSDEDKKVAEVVRQDWEQLLQQKLKPFIATITGKEPQDWLQSICGSDGEYQLVSKHLKSPWSNVIHIGKTTLKGDHIDQTLRDVQGGFEYIERTNSWLLDDGFLAGLKKRLSGNPQTDLLQAARLFFFHEALHYAGDGHRLTREIADGIGQFPKVIEDADYQADVWALLTDYRYCQIYAPEKLEGGVKAFFCNSIDTAVETMWSFVDTGTELESIQIRSMNRFLNWYWQWVRIENLKEKGTLEEVVCILLDKPVIEFAGAPMMLRAHRTYYKLNVGNAMQLQLAAFLRNRIYRFTPNMIGSIVDGFRQLNGEKIKAGLKSFYNTIA